MGIMEERIVMDAQVEAEETNQDGALALALAVRRCPVFSSHIEAMGLNAMRCDVSLYCAGGFRTTVGGRWSSCECNANLPLAPVACWTQRALVRRLTNSGYDGVVAAVSGKDLLMPRGGVKRGACKRGICFGKILPGKRHGQDCFGEMGVKARRRPACLAFHQDRPKRTVNTAAGLLERCQSVKVLATFDVCRLYRDCRHAFVQHHQ